MSDETSMRLGLPFLSIGQAQKESSHNEALALLDIAVQPVVAAVGLDAPPEAEAGACWIVGAAPSGAWSGHAHAIAGWTDGGWRFVPAQEGMTAWSIADAAPARFSGGRWTIGELRGARLVLGGETVVGPRRPAIPAPAGGGVVDSEARAALGAVLDALRAHGLIAS